MPRTQKGVWDKKQEQGGTRPLPLIYLIPLGLPSTFRTSPHRSRKIGEDESDPPEKRGVM